MAMRTFLSRGEEKGNSLSATDVLITHTLTCPSCSTAVKNLPALTCNFLTSGYQGLTPMISASTRRVAFQT